MRAGGVIGHHERVANTSQLYCISISTTTVHGTASAISLRLRSLMQEVITQDLRNFLQIMCKPLGSSDQLENQ